MKLRSGVALLSLLILGAGCVSTNYTSATSGIHGQVTLGPTCPVQRPNDPNCADKPYQTSLIVLTEDGKLAANVQSDAQGNFTVGLMPGNYIVSPAPSNRPLPRAAPQPVRVNDNQFTDITIQFDTGIR